MGKCILLRPVGFYDYYLYQEGLAWSSAVVMPGRLLPSSTTSDFRDAGKGRTDLCRGSRYQNEVLGSTETPGCLFIFPSACFWIHTSMYLDLQLVFRGVLECGKFCTI